MDHTYTYDSSQLFDEIKGGGKRKMGISLAIVLEITYQVKRMC